MKPTESKRFRYVRYDPHGGHAFDRKASNLKKAHALPWIAAPHFIKEFSGVRNYTRSFKRFATEREAALFVDKWFIDNGRPPVNILVRKS